MKEREQFLEQMKETLLARAAEIRKLIKQQREEAPPERVVQDSADEAHSSLMSKLQSSLEQNEIAELKAIDEAIDRIKEGDYGLCEECGEPISAKRLEAFPFAAHCITCKEKLEG